MLISSGVLVSITSPSFVAPHLQIANVLLEGVFTRTTYSYMPIYVPIIMCGLRMFIVVLQKIHCLPNIYHDIAHVVTEFYHYVKFDSSTVSNY